MVQDGVEWFGDTTPSIAVTVTRRLLRLQVTPISKIGAIETIKIDAFDAVTNAPVAGTVTSSITPPAATGSNITFTRPSATECTEGPTGKPICRKVPQPVAFTVTASVSGYDPATISY